MKKCLKSLAIMLSAIMTVGMVMPTAANAAEAMYVESDTTVNFSVVQGKTYAFKFTVHGAHSNPKIVAGNSAVLRTENVKHVVEKDNNVYYFKVRAVGKVGQSSAVYTTLPGQKAVRQCVITVSENPEETLLNIAKSADSSEATPMDDGTYYEDFDGDGTKDLLYFSRITTPMEGEYQLDTFHVDAWYVDGKSQKAVESESLEDTANALSPYTFSVGTIMFKVQDKPEIFINTQSGGSAGPTGTLFELGNDGEFRSLSGGQYMEQRGQELWSIDIDYSTGHRKLAYSKLIWDAASRTYSKEFQYYHK